MRLLASILLFLLNCNIAIAADEYVEPIESILLICNDNFVKVEESLKLEAPENMKDNSNIKAALDNIKSGHKELESICLSAKYWENQLNAIKSGKTIDTTNIGLIEQVLSSANNTYAKWQANHNIFYQIIDETSKEREEKLKAEQRKIELDLLRIKKEQEEAKKNKNAKNICKKNKKLLKRKSKKGRDLGMSLKRKNVKKNLKKNKKKKKINI